MDNTPEQLNNFLRQACFGGNLSAAQARHAEGADPSAPDIIGFTPLLLALKNGYVHVASWLLSVGANVNAATTMNENVLHAATKLNDPILLQSILDAGADVWMKTADDWSALHTAASARAINCIPVLTRAGLSLDVPDESQMRPIHVAARSPEEGAEAFIAAAIQQGASVDAKDAAGRTALHYAADKGCRPSCEILAASGADINAVDSVNKRPLDLADSWGIELFLRARGGVSLKKPDQPTVEERIRASAMSGQADVLLTLMESGRQPPSSLDIQAAIDLAKQLGHDNVIAAMQSMQAKLQIAAIRSKNAAPGFTSS